VRSVVRKLSSRVTESGVPSFLSFPFLCFLTPLRFASTGVACTSGALALIANLPSRSVEARGYSSDVSLMRCKNENLLLLLFLAWPHSIGTENFGGNECGCMWDQESPIARFAYLIFQMCAEERQHRD